MAELLSIDEISQGADADVDQQKERRYTRVFRLTYDGPSIGPGRAVIDQMVKFYDSYEEPGGFADPGALCIGGGAAAEDPDTSYNWLATLRYSSKWWDDVARNQFSGGDGTTGKPPHGGSGGSPAEENSPANPIARPWSYAWGTTTERELMEHDLSEFNDGQGILIGSTAGEPYDPPWETDRELLTLTLKRNTLNYDPLLAKTFFNHTNNADVFIGQRSFSQGSLLCKYWTAESQGPESNICYWGETIFLIHKLGREIPNHPDKKRQKWLRIALNAGLKQLVNGEMVPIMFKGEATSIPLPLDPTGRWLGPTPNPKDYYYRTYVEFPETDFGPMNLR